MPEKMLWSSEALEISAETLASALEKYLERKPTLKELIRFKNYVEIDVSEWLKTNTRRFVREKLINKIH